MLIPPSNLLHADLTKQPRFFDQKSYVVNASCEAPYLNLEIPGPSRLWQEVRDTLCPLCYADSHLYHTEILLAHINPSPSLFPRLLLLRLLQHLLHDLLLLNQECPHDSVSDAVPTSRAAVRSSDGLLGVAGRSVFAGSEGWDLWSANVSIVVELCKEEGCRRRFDGAEEQGDLHLGVLIRNHRISELCLAF